MSAPDSAYLQMLSDLFSETVVKTLTHRLIERSSEAGVTHSDYKVLRYLHSHGRCTIGHIAEGLSVSYPASTKFVTRLTEKNLVTRTEGISDRRQAEVDLTKRGHEVIARLRQARLDRFDDILNRLSPDDRSALIHGMERFLVAAVEDKGVANEICLRCGTDRLDECPVSPQEILGPSMIPIDFAWDTDNDLSIEPEIEVTHGG